MTTYKVATANVILEEIIFISGLITWADLNRAESFLVLKNGVKCEISWFTGHGKLEDKAENIQKEMNTFIKDWSEAINNIK